TDILTLAQLRPAIDAMASSAHRRLSADGRAARTVVLKLKKTDMSIVTRSSTLPYATEDLVTLTAAAQRSALDPVEIGPIRLVGVGFAGLSEIRQESLFPELDQTVDADAVAEEPTLAAPGGPDPLVPPATRSFAIGTWYPGLDVEHPDFGHGWVQGAGHGVVTVRFETRSTGSGPTRTFAAEDPALTRADPLGSLR
ncbi:DNA polymerase IV, partial [Streptomyces sp. NPDC101166]